MALEGFDLKGLTVGELDKLIELATKQKTHTLEAEKENVRHQIEELAKKAGFSVDELLGARRGRKRTGTTRAKAEPKYENPSNKSETWSGRGRKPKWVDRVLNGGKKLEELAIRQVN